MTYHIVRKFLGIVLLRVNLFHNIVQTWRILWICLHILPVLVPQQLLMLPPYLVRLKSNFMGQINSIIIHSIFK